MTYREEKRLRLTYREEKRLRREREDLLRRYDNEMQIINKPITDRIHEINCALTPTNFAYIARRA